MGCTWQWETHGKGERHDDRRNMTPGSTWNDDTYNNANDRGWARMMDGLEDMEREREREVGTEHLEEIYKTVKTIGTDKMDRKDKGDVRDEWDIASHSRHLPLISTGTTHDHIHLKP